MVVMSNQLYKGQDAAIDRAVCKTARVICERERRRFGGTRHRRPTSLTKRSMVADHILRLTPLDRKRALAEIMEVFEKAPDGMRLFHSFRS